MSLNICCLTAKEADITKKNNENPETIEKEDVAAEEEIKEEAAAKDGEKETVEADTQPDPLEEANNKYLRLAAEYDNFKKRTQKEKIQIYTDAAADVIEAMLPFLDNLERASAVEAESEDAKKILEGIILMQRQFEDALKSLGVEPIKAVGEKFDPNLHNAVMHVDDESVEGEDIVAEEFIKGYKYKDKVVRHSTVKVAN